MNLSHNRAGKDLRFDISFFDISGKLLAQELRDCYSCEGLVNFGMNVESFFPVSGKFLYRVKAKEIANNQQSSKSGHLLFWT